jgi:hypothetical protein
MAGTPSGAKRSPSHGNDFTTPGLYGQLVNGCGPGTMAPPRRLGPGPGQYPGQDAGPAGLGFGPGGPAGQNGRNGHDIHNGARRDDRAPKKQSSRRRRRRLGSDRRTRAAGGA